MKCPICGKDVELQKKQVGLDESGNPILNEYAVCRDCKKQWNLDKQRAKKKTAKSAVQEPAENNNDTQKPVNEPTAQKQPADAVSAVEKTIKAISDADIAAAAVINADASASEKAVPKKVKKSSGSQPKKKVKKRPAEAASTDVTTKPVTKKKQLTPEERAERAKRAAQRKANEEKKTSVPKTTKQVEVPKKAKAVAEQTTAKRRRPLEDESENYLGNVPPKKVRKKREHAVRQNYEDMLATDPRSTHKHKKAVEKPMPEEEMIDDIPKARFRVLRILLGILSIAGCGFCVYRGFTSGITSISAITDSALGITFTVLASGTLVSGLLLFLMQGTNNIFAFLLPMLIYLGCGTFAFLNRSEDSILLYAAIAGAVGAVLFIILAITSRGDEEDYDSFDDDDYYDDED